MYIVTLSNPYPLDSISRVYTGQECARFQKRQQNKGAIDTLISVTLGSSPFLERYTSPIQKGLRAFPFSKNASFLGKGDWCPITKAAKEKREQDFYPSRNFQSLASKTYSIGVCSVIEAIANEPRTLRLTPTSRESMGKNQKIYLQKINVSDCSATRFSIVVEK